MSATDSAFVGIPDSPSGSPIKFETWEHVSIGDNLFLTTSSGEKVVAGTHVLKVVDGVLLTVGKVVGFAGDYYTVPGNHAITGDYKQPTPSFEAQKGNAKKAVYSFMGNRGRYMKALEKLYLQERKALKKALDEGGAAAVAYHKKIGLPSDLTYSLATWLYYPRISWNNFDHFGDDALSAYAACHAVALELAATPNGSEKSLNEAYIAEAFGLHFLTDSFSSGHMRAPRRALHDNNPLTAFPSGLAGAPVWDTQSRYMHDEDSALGLWVQNEEGSEWIAFGDKQYFDGHCRINRLRCERASQASLDEIYSAFTSRTVTEKSSFAALRLAPKPKLASTAQGRGWDHDNFSPLWVWNPASKQQFTIRRDVNDHSRFQRDEAYPGYVPLQWPPFFPAKAAQKVKESAYKNFGEFPLSKPMEPTSGGFVQIQEFLEDKTVLSSANVWGPIAINLPKETLTFSLRNRTRKFSEHETSVRTLGWSKFFEKTTGRTSFVRFSHAGEKSDLKFDVWSFTTDTTSQVVDFNDLDTMPLVFGGPDIQDRTLIPNFEGHGLSSARFFIEPWLGSEPDIIAVTFGGENWTPRITISGFGGGGGGAATLDFVDTAAAKLAWGHMKLFNIDGAKRLLLACAIPDPHQRSTDLILRDYTPTASGSVAVNQTTIKLPGAAGLHIQALIGDVQATGADQLVVLIGARVQLYTITALPSGQLVYTPTETQSSTAAQIPTQDHILTALLPSEGAQPGLDILSISSVPSIKRASNESRSLEFTVSVRGGQGKVSLVEDPLQEDPHYVSISWHRAQYRASKNAVMQVFSWYGMLGTRLFAPKPDGEGVYEIVGCCASMGQPASAMILEWGPTEGWIDFAVYNPRPEL